MEGGWFKAPSLQQYRIPDSGFSVMIPSRFRL